MGSDNKSVKIEFAKQYSDAWCSQDPSSVAAFYSPDGSLRINGGELLVGRPAITESARTFMTTFPDLKVIMEGCAEKDGIWVYSWRLEGTHNETGKRVCIKGFEEWVFGKDGLVNRSVGGFDVAEYQRQVVAGY